MTRPSPRIYLAGPTVFEPDPDAIFVIMKTICTRHGLEGISPLDGQLGLEGQAPGREMVAQIVRADIGLMHAADGAVFCLDGFRRSPEMDPGTAFEIGFMLALGKPLAGWTRDPRPYPERVRAYFAETFALPLVPGTSGGPGARSGDLRDPDGILVHSEGCLQNAMTEIGIELSGGAVAAHEEWQTAFEHAVLHLARRLGPVLAFETLR